MNIDGIPEYLFTDEACRYLRIDVKKLRLYRRYGLIRWGKTGREFFYRRSWCDEFMETWSGYDLSSESKVKLAINSKKWREAHGEN